MLQMGDVEDELRLVLSSSEDEDCVDTMDFGRDDDGEVVAVVDRVKVDPGLSDPKARGRLSDLLQNLTARVKQDNTADVAAPVGDERLAHAQQGGVGGETRGGVKKKLKSSNKLTRGKNKAAKRKLILDNETEDEVSRRGD